jgi:hypothetical protein
MAAIFLIRIKLFAIDKPIVSLILHEFVVATNLVFKKLIFWPEGHEMQKMMEDFKVLCDLLSMQGAIDGTRLLIFKPSILYHEDYYYHKSKGYSMVAQAMVDSNKIFMYIYISLLGNVNDSQVLKRQLGGLLLIENA